MDKKFSELLNILYTHTLASYLSLSLASYLVPKNKFLFSPTPFHACLVASTSEGGSRNLPGTSEGGSRYRQVPVRRREVRVTSLEFGQFLRPTCPLWPHSHREDSCSMFPVCVVPLHSPEYCSLAHVTRRLARDGGQHQQHSWRSDSKSSSSSISRGDAHGVLLVLP